MTLPTLEALLRHIDIDWYELSSIKYKVSAAKKESADKRANKLLSLPSCSESQRMSLRAQSGKKEAVVFRQAGN